MGHIYPFAQVFVCARATSLISSLLPPPCGSLISLILCQFVPQPPPWRPSSKFLLARAKSIYEKQSPASVHGSDEDRPSHDLDPQRARFHALRPSPPRRRSPTPLLSFCSLSSRGPRHASPASPASGRAARHSARPRVDCARLTRGSPIGLQI